MLQFPTVTVIRLTTEMTSIHMYGDAYIDISIIKSSINVHTLTLTIGLDSPWPEEVITGLLAVSNHSLVVILSFHVQGDDGTGSSLRFFSKVMSGWQERRVWGGGSAEETRGNGTNWWSNPVAALLHC